METFSALLAICAGNLPVPGEFPAQRPVTRSLGVFFDLRLNKRLSKQSWGWWFETLSHPLWRHCNGLPHGGLNKMAEIFQTTFWNTFPLIRILPGGTRPLPLLMLAKIYGVRWRILWSLTIIFFDKMTSFKMAEISRNQPVLRWCFIDSICYSTRQN